MPERELPFLAVESLLRRKKFGFLSTADKNGVPHTAGVIYVVSPPSTSFHLYVLTGISVKKARNIRENQCIAFGIPFTHHVIRPAPDFCIQFQGKAEILPFTDPEANAAYRQNAMMRKMLESQQAGSEGSIFIKITPDEKIFGFGLGMNIFSLLKNIESGRFVTRIPAECRRVIQQV
jgi:nitroimidazol reductase NimA-like FMN-containing flavoprotein (pyridoxamine 5'-phosphate oxidase superfamily)